MRARMLRVTESRKKRIGIPSAWLGDGLRSKRA
jgi:hypothetical protein